MAQPVLPNPDMDFTPLDVLTAADMDKIVANINYLKDYSGRVASGAEIADGSIEPVKIRNAGALTGTAQFQKLPEQSWSAGSWQKKNGSDLTFTTTQPNQKVVLFASLQFYQGGYSKARWKIDNAYTNIIQFNSGIANTTTASQTLMIVHTVPTPGTHSASLEISAGGSLRIIDGEGSANYAVFPALG